MKELTEPPAVSASRRAFELARSFDPEDDFEFCRGLWTEDDVCISIIHIDNSFRSQQVSDKTRTT